MLKIILSLTALASLGSAEWVKGKAFDRFAVIWLENTDYDLAAGDPNLSYLAKKGISLTNHFAVTHPSMPNYAAAISGDYYGINHDDQTAIPANVSTLVDLLENRGVSWGEYQEDMPSVGFQGNYKNPKTGANMYVRKHNPAVLYDSVAKNQDRLAKTKPLSMFYDDLKANALPQWMFITPNMTSDGMLIWFLLVFSVLTLTGHDTTVTTAGKHTLLEVVCERGTDFAQVHGLVISWSHFSATRTS
jgi:acid phosphatase